jgi:hypothetical protein
MEEFLYYFGYEDPINKEVNQRMNTDYESSRLIRILAENSQKAVEWGDEVAEHFVKFIFNDDTISWKTDGFASGIEEEVDDYTKNLWNKIPLVKYGEYPNFETLDEIDD